MSKVARSKSFLREPKQVVKENVEPNVNVNKKYGLRSAKSSSNIVSSVKDTKPVTQPIQPVTPNHGSKSTTSSTTSATGSAKKASEDQQSKTLTQLPKLANVSKCSKMSWADTDFSRFFNDKMYADVTLKFSARHVKAHKMILASASPVFDDLFKDPNVTEVVIKEMSYQSFNWTLEFVYTKKIKLLASTPSSADIEIVNLFDLLSAAQIYKIDPLINYAETLISDHLSRNNVVDILTLSFDKNLSVLMDKSINFIISEGDPCSLDNWKDVYRYRGLLDMLFTKLLPKKPKSQLPKLASSVGVSSSVSNVVGVGVSRSRSTMKGFPDKKSRSQSNIRR